jgi:hypothetical protein
MKKLRISAKACCAVLMAMLASPAQADMSGDCEKHALAFSKKQGGTMSRIQIERSQSPIADRYDDHVGSQFVSTELSGFARVTSPDGAKRMRYLCLHDGKKAVYVYLFE